MGQTSFKAAARPVIIGGGLAGLMTALHLAPRPVLVLSKAPLGSESSSAWAQGGLAAAIGADDDPDRHLADTLAAGDGLCDPAVAARIVAAGPRLVETLLRLGVQFGRAADGTLSLGREAAHGRRRIVHAGDRTGAEILRAVTASVRATASIEVLEDCDVRHIAMRDGRVMGLLASHRGRALEIRTGQIVIATGGVGGLYDASTNPAGSFGQGIALAARAGAALRDMEFVQFHPTALDGAPPTLKLISEALRGEGAILIDETGTRFMVDQPGAELAPRDIVARAIWRHRTTGHQTFLDARSVFADRHRRAHFAGIDAICRDAGIDPAMAPIPVRPAAHYHMGGIAVDGCGRSTVPGLWACGEAACTGLHGANRLASNSLLEAAVCAGWVAEDLAGQTMPPPCASAMPALPPAPDPTPIRPVISAAASVWRDGPCLQAAIGTLTGLIDANSPGRDPAIVALLIMSAALRRQESRGAHARSDCPAKRPGARSITISLAEALAQTRQPAESDA